MDEPPKSYRCSLEPTLDAIGAKWKGVILFHLMDGTQRFNQLQRLAANVTHKMLTQHLRELECDGLIARTIYDEAIPHVEYSLTDFGRTLQPVLLVMRDWGLQHVGRLEDNRAEHRQPKDSGKGG